MSEPATGPLYDLWSNFYDHTFGRLVHQRQLAALEHLRARPGQRVLDLGVGTGMTLEHYPAGVQVVGMDLSAGMLAQAAEKAHTHQLPHPLVRADAMHPPFADASFDRILVTHTVSVVSDPTRLIHEAERMLRPGGRIVVLNHFRSPSAVMGGLEKLTNPLFVRVGWRSDLSVEEMLSGTGLTLAYGFKPRRLDLWQILVLVHAGEAASAGNAQ